MNKTRFIILLGIALLSLALVGFALAADNVALTNQEGKPEISGDTTAEIAPIPIKEAENIALPMESGITGVATDYGWAQTLGTYVVITGGTQVTTSCDDTNYNAISLPFNISFNGTDYAQVSIQCNGFIAMGPTVVSSYTPISSGTSNNIIVALGGDQQTNTVDSEIRYETLGTAPNQVFVIQWKNFRHYGATGDIYNYQIRLYETSNLVEVIYGPFTQNATVRTSQVGLRGASNADFNNRTSTADWINSIAGTVNNATMALTTAYVPPSGLTWDWVPLPPSPDYSESMKYAPGTVAFGEPIEYTIIITNTGDAPGMDTLMVDPIPAGTIYNNDVVCTSGTCFYDQGTNTLYWSGQVSENPVIITFSVTPADPECGTIILNEATITDPEAFAPVTISASTDVWEMVHLSEDFEGDIFPPSGWVEAYDITGTMWTNLDIGLRGNLTGGAGKFAIVDDDEAGAGALTVTQLWTPLFDIPAGNYATHLLFKTDYNNISANESANVDISLDGGATWINLLHWNSDHRGPLTQAVDLTDFGGATGAILRFYYDDGDAYAWWWEIDDVQVVSCYVAYPDIEVSPTQLDASLEPDQQITQQLNICNVGEAPLTWDLSEVVPGTGLKSVLAPTDMGYAQDIGYVSDNFVSFALNDFTGQTVVGTNTTAYYGIDFDPSATTLYALSDTSDQLGTIDLATGAFTGLVPCPPGGGAANWTGLTIDPVTGDFYASTATELYMIDPNTGISTLVGPFGTTLMIEIAMGPNGEMYGHDIGTDSIYQIDPTTGAATLIGLTGYAANYAQGMDFDNQDGTLYIWLYIGSGANVYGTVNLATGAVTPLAVDAPQGEFEGATQTTAGPPPDLTWLSENPLSGEVLPGDCSLVDVTFDSTGLAPAIYLGELDIDSNDPDESPVFVPVTLTVEFLAEPDIDVTPTSLSTEQLPDQVTTQIMNIGNLGDGDLIWEIIEESGAVQEFGPPINNLPQANQDVAPVSRYNISPMDLGDWLYDIDAGATTFDTQLLGVEFDGTYLWVTGGNSSLDPNKLYKLEIDGTLVATYDQASDAGWGWRDLAFDGTYLYGSDSGVVEQIDPATGMATGVTIPSPVNPARALAYDAATDHFWAANWDSIIYEFDRTGAVINAFPAVGLSTYGMAWEESPDGASLWLWSQDGPDPLLMASELDPLTGQLTGTSFIGVGVAGEMAGGAAITSGLVPGKVVFLGMIQGISDRISIYELSTLSQGCIPSDVPWLSASPTIGTTPAGNSTPVEVMFDSTGMSVGEYTANLCIENNDPDEPLVNVPVMMSVIGEPDIMVDPLTLSAEAIQGQMVTQPMTITNIGELPLNWELYDGLPSISWSDNFDSYPTGSQMHGQGGWKGWANDPNAGALTTDAEAHSAPNSVAIVNVSDLVHEYSGINSGLWTYTAWQYIPLDATGERYFILLNQYDDAGLTNNWSVQVDFNADTNLVVNTGISAGQLPMIKGSWVEIRVEIDLDNDTTTFYYGDQVLYTGTWTDEISGGGILNIAAIDLWGNLATVSYYDDISLMPAFDPACGVWGDIPWLSTDPTNGMTLPGESSLVDVWFDSLGLDIGTYHATLCAESNDPDEPLVPIDITFNVVGEPDIVVTPLSLDMILMPNQIGTLSFTISNIGTADLVWALSGDSPLWMSEDPTSGIVPSGESIDVTVTFDATGLAAGTYEGFLIVESNDPDDPPMVTVTLTVMNYNFYLPMVSKN